MDFARCVGRITLVLGLSGGFATAGEPVRFEARQTHMGSEFKILLYTADPESARRASDRAFLRIRDLDRKLSDYDPESELMKLCDRAGGPPVKVSSELFRCLELAQKMSQQSEGAFDATVGPAVRQWRRARRDGKFPSAENLDRARKLVDYRQVQLDPARQTIRLNLPGMKLDLGGIAKGYACDEAVAVLRDEGITSALVSGAGDIVALGSPPGRPGWTVGILAPDGDPAHPSRFLALKDAAISTSGDRERFVVIDGRRYAHIVDPRTGIGVISRASVTVVARDGATADSLATAAYVLGSERGIELVDRIPGAAALFVRIDGDAKTVASSRWNMIPGARSPETKEPGE